MKNTYGYRPYRGSRVRRRGMIINALLVVLIVAAAVWVFSLLLPHERDGARGMMGGRVADDGTSIADTASMEAAPAASGGGETVRVPSVMKNPGKAQPIFPAPPEGPENRRMVLCEAEELAESAETLIGLRESGSITGAAVVMKDGEGRLRYPSGIARVQGSGIVDPAEGIAEAVAQLRASGVPLTAVVYVSEDSLFPELYEACALKNVDGESWRDPDGRLYTDPANGEALQYLTEVAAELRVMGFSEILLRGIGYPAEGALERIVYADVSEYEDDNARVVTGLVMAVKTAVPAMRVSVWLDSPELDENPETGQCIHMLGQIADRFFVELPGSDPDEAPAIVQAVQGEARDIVGGTGREAEHIVFATDDTEGTEALGEVLFDLPLRDLLND